MDYRVKLPEFAGPLDLLLHLVRRQEVDIHEISIAKILEDFLEYLKALDTLDLNNIGDFVVMATTLMEMKSRELLPRDEVDLQEELDPRDELIRQLLEYRRYRELTRRLDRYGRMRERLLARGGYGADQERLRELAHEELEREYEDSLDMEDLDAWGLLKAYAKLLAETDFGTTYTIEAERKPLVAYMDELLARLAAQGPGTEIRFQDAFDRREGRMGVIGTFMAVLELIKQERLRARQDRNFDTIWIALVPGAPAARAENSPGRAREPRAVDPTA